MTYIDGGIMDMDDLLSDLVEDREKVRAEATGQFWCSRIGGSSPFPVASGVLIALTWREANYSRESVALSRA